MCYRNGVRLALALACSTALIPAATAQTPANNAKLTSEQVENALKLAKIEFTKPAAPIGGGYVYDFKIRDFNLRLTGAAGPRLTLSTLMPGLAPDKVKQWNASGKLSKVALGEDDKKNSYSVLEAQLDLKDSAGSVAIQEFLAAYTKELAEFEAIVKAESPSADVANEEDAFKEVVPARLEKTLADLKIKFTKVPFRGGFFAYRYQANNTPIVLTNWGKDMMLEAKFPKVSIDKVNRYNLERKFIRAVAYNNKLGAYAGLEANLSFQGGITDSIVRNFIAVFEEDVREFGAYVAKASQ